MAGMTNTKYGYVTTQEAKKDARLDIWYRDNKRRKQHAKNKKM